MCKEHLTFNTTITNRIDLVGGFTVCYNNKGTEHVDKQQRLYQYMVMDMP